MKLRLNKAHFPVNGLGPGQRVGLWFQGCTIRCKGCASLDTWGLRPDTTIDVDKIITWCQSHLMRGADGVTVTGGEPFDQPAGLRYLLNELQSFGERFSLEFDVLCFTGLSYHYVEDKFSDVLSLLDAIVSEPFEEHLPTRKYLCGSDNQVLRLLSKRGKERFKCSEAVAYMQKHMDVSVSMRSMYLSGIPRDSDLVRLSEALATRGVSVGKVSWRE
jgi:anaerobic ribonucleoside-triphosphate reductase activating protein